MRVREGAADVVLVLLKGKVHMFTRLIPVLPQHYALYADSIYRYYPGGRMPLCHLAACVMREMGVSLLNYLPFTFGDVTAYIVAFVSYLQFD